MEQLNNNAPEKCFPDPSVTSYDTKAGSARYGNMMAPYFREAINPAKYPGIETDPVMQQLYYQVGRRYLSKLSLDCILVDP
jgi:hypothetical protein